MIAVDTNLLVYAHRAAVPEHAAARKAIESAVNDPRGWGIPHPVVAEFWSIVTHPAASGRPSRPAEATDFVRALLRRGGAQAWFPGPGFVERLLQLASDLAVPGPRIFDLQIALTAFDNGATELWTRDRAFVSLPGLKVIDPLA